MDFHDRKMNGPLPTGALGATLTVLVLGFAALLTAQATSLPPEPAGFKLDGDLDNGKLIYKQYCQKCHGKRGDGSGLMAKDLTPKPANFTDPDRMSKVSDWEIFIGIKEGGKPVGLSDQMTAWKDTLDEQEMLDVGTFIRGFLSD